ncbi:MAG TPA: hypothetical protein VMT17_06020 [Anaeromyxobacteraceae bacterium]|nr:hypothetical protein [Anaeromyxobacteraceae bacterium]
MRLGTLDNHDQELWKAPLPQFIEHLYLRRFGRERPEVVMSIEERACARREKKKGGSQGSVGHEGGEHRWPAVR